VETSGETGADGTSSEEGILSMVNIVEAVWGARSVGLWYTHDNPFCIEKASPL
jgi:hypothetical protein